MFSKFICYGVHHIRTALIHILSYITKEPQSLIDFGFLPKHEIWKAICFPSHNFIYKLLLQYLQISSLLYTLNVQINSCTSPLVTITYKVNI